MLDSDHNNVPTKGVMADPGTNEHILSSFKASLLISITLGIKNKASPADATQDCSQQNKTCNYSILRA